MGLKFYSTKKLHHCVSIDNLNISDKPLAQYSPVLQHRSPVCGNYPILHHFAAQSSHFQLFRSRFQFDRHHRATKSVKVKICEVTVAGGKLLNVGSNSIVINNGNSLDAAGAFLKHIFVALLFLFEDSEVARGNLRIQKDIAYCAYL